MVSLYISGCAPIVISQKKTQYLENAEKSNMHKPSDHQAN